MFIKRKRYNAELGMAYAKGLSVGKEIGRKEMVLEKVTLNEIRAAVGLPPIDGCKKGDKE